MRKEKEMRQEIFLNMWKSCQRLQLIYTKKKKPPFLRRFLAGDERIELPLKVLETSVIPFDQSPLYTFKTAYTFHPYLTTFLLRFQPLS